MSAMGWNDERTAEEVEISGASLLSVSKQTPTWPEKARLSIATDVNCSGDSLDHVPKGNHSFSLGPYQNSFSQCWSLDCRNCLEIALPVLILRALGVYSEQHYRLVLNAGSPDATADELVASHEDYHADNISGFTWFPTPSTCSIAGDNAY